MRTQIAEIAPLTPEQRRKLRQQVKLSEPVVQASINVIGASDNVTAAVGQPAEEVRQMVDDSNRWTAVEDELRAMLNGIAGANVVRRQKIRLIAAQAFTIGQQLVRNPEHAALVPHIAEVKRLKGFSRRKRPQQTPEPPAPAPQASTASETQQVPETPGSAVPSTTSKA